MSRGGGRGGGWRGKPMAAGGIDVPDGLVVSYHEIPLYPPHPGTQPFPVQSSEDEGLMEAYWSLKKNMEESAFYLFKADQRPGMIFPCSLLIHLPSWSIHREAN